MFVKKKETEVVKIAENHRKLIRCCRAFCDINVRLWSFVCLLFWFGVNTCFAESAKKCPAGLFCTTGGTYVPYDGGIAPYMLGPADLATIGWGMWSEEDLCPVRGKYSSGCSYYTEDYDEVWVSVWFGYYMVKNGEVIYHKSKDSNAPGAFPCPGTYPVSAECASSVFECYRVASGGQKEYYKPQDLKSDIQICYKMNNFGKKSYFVPLFASEQKLSNVGKDKASGNHNIDIETVNVLVQDLQAALSKAQSLQKALNNESVSRSDQNVQTISDIDRAKKLISSGIIDVPVSKSATRSKK